MGDTVPYRGGSEPADQPPTDAGAPTRVTAFDETLPTATGDSEIGEGSKIGRYEVLERVGAGGMGVVYRAHDPELHREVALKLLKAGRSTGPAAKKRRKRLLREARAMAQLSHPNVIPVYDVGEYGSGLYVAMEFVLGSNARDWLKAEKPPWRRTLGVFRAAGRGLAAAHNAGLVHRDFKPANVLVGDDGRVRVLDFGLARAAADEPEPELVATESNNESDGNWSETLTADGTILGTPVYMSPEQFAGKLADPRSDQYSFCIALFEALFGTLPFAKGTIKQQAHAKYKGRIAPMPADSPVPARLYEVLCRGLAAKPELRHESMPAVLRELRTVHEDRTPAPAWRSWAIVGSVLALASAAVGVAYIGDGPPATTEAATCTPAHEVLGGAWDDDDRARVREAFVAADVSQAEARFEELATNLDARVGAWSQRYNEVCGGKEAKDPHARRQYAATMACLNRHRVELAAFVDALDEPSGVVIARAPTAALSLPSLNDCSVDLTAPRSAEREEQRLKLAQQLGGARALRTTGRPDAAMREVEQVLERAKAAELRGIESRALLERARLHRGRDNLSAAQRDLEAAYFSAVADRNPRLAATAAVSLVDMFASRQANEEAMVWSEHARSQLDAAGESPGLDAALEQALGQLPPP